MKFEIYREGSWTSDPGREWRWRLKAKNGRIVADSGEAYSSERAVRRAIYRLNESIVMRGSLVPIEVVEQ